MADLEQHQRLLANGGRENQQNSLLQQTLKSSANLANLLPTGTVLAFQLLIPTLTNQGACDPASRALTGIFIALSGFSCFILSFSDSFQDEHGVVRYGFATFKGLWVIDGSPPPRVEDGRYKLKFLDFVHGLMSLLVFAAVALLNQNVVSCFYPIPSQSVKRVVSSLPMAIGVVCSMLFVTFPTTRHGIGFPITHV